MRIISFLLGAALLGPALSGAASATDWSGFGNGARTFLVENGHARPMLFLCEEVDRKDLRLASIPAANGRADLVRLVKPTLAESHRAVVIGDGDPGAGQIFYPLTSTGGADIGNLHAVNPGVFDQPVTTAALVEVKVDGVTGSCRFEPQIRFLGAAPKRTIMITGPAGGPYRYQSFDYASPVVPLPSPAGGRTKPTLSIMGGQATAIPGGRRFTFASGGYVFRVDATGAGARITVLHNGGVLLANSFKAYTLAAATP